MGRCRPAITRASPSRCDFRNHGTGIDYKLRKETWLHIVVKVGRVELEEDTVAIVVARVAEEDV